MINVKEIKDRTIAHFNKQWGEEYNTFQSFDNPDFIKHLLMFTNSISTEWVGKKVFEGCAGSGRNTFAALKLGIASITVTDISDGAVKSILKNTKDFEGKVNAYPSDLANLPNEVDNTYDIVFAVNGVNHIPDWKNAVAEMVRICKPGGLIMFNMPPKRPKMIEEVDTKIREYSTQMCPHCLKLFSQIIVYFHQHPVLRNVLSNKMELSSNELNAYDHFGLPYTDSFYQEEITTELQRIGCEVVAINNLIAVKAKKL